MRLTNNMMSKTYLSNLNSSLERLNASNLRISSERSFMTMSEDPATAIKAMAVRKNLSRNEAYQENLSNAQGIVDQYETTIASINDVVTDAVSQVLQGVTGTSSEDARVAIASALRGYQETILSTANTVFGDDYIFGGDQVDKTPFTLAANGALLYNGQNVDTGTFKDEYRYIDVGIGIEIDGTGEVNSASAFNIANSGTTLLGTGVDGNGITNNLYNLLGKLADMFENNDMDDIQVYSDKLDTLADDVRVQYVSVGAKSDYISYFTKRLEAEEFNATKKLSDLEDIDIEEETINYAEMKLAYDACLQMGTKLLQPSLMNYLD